MENFSTSKSKLKIIFIFLIICLIFLVFAVFMSFGLVNRESVTSMSGLTNVGKDMPKINAKSFEEETVVLDPKSNIPMVINFWASWCAPCVDEAPVLQQSWEQYRDEGVLFVGVNFQDDPADAQEHISHFEITYPNLADPEGHISIDFGVIGNPVTFFVDSDGTVSGRYVGSIPKSQLDNWLSDLD